MRYKKVLIRTLSILIVIVLAVETIWDFSSQVQRALTRETYRTLSEVSHDYNKAFVDHISYNGKTMNVLANALQEMRGQSKQDVIRMLKNAMSDGGFTQMLACDTKGLSCSSDGIVEDLSQRDYFQKAMYGLAVGSSPPISVVATEESILLAVPISHEGETVGILFGRYPLAVVGSELLNFNYYRDGYGFVVSPDGTILFSSEHTDKLANEKNLFSFFEKTSLIHFSMEELKTAIANGKSKSFAFTYNGERRFVSFMPSTINDWVTFSISSDALMLQQEKVTNQIVLRLITRLAVAGVLLFAWIVWRNRRHNKEILAANQQYQSLLSHINGGMIVAVHAQTAQETIATYVSPGFTDMTGYTLEDLQNLYHGRYLDVILAEEREAVFKKYLEQLAVGNTYWMPYRIRKKDGSFLWVMDNGYLVRGADGLHNHSIITDITAVKAQEEELRMSESRFSVAINASSGTLLEVDLKQKVFTHFENSKRIFAVSAQRLLDDTRAFSLLPYDEFMDAVIRYFFHSNDYERTKNALNDAAKNGVSSYEARVRRADNSYIWARIDLSMSLNEFGMPTRLVGFISDIDDMKKQAEILENQVQTDPMTGLYNKMAMATLSNKILAEYPEGRHALLVLDIDNFKGINDTLGHAFGDVVLTDVCTKLKSLFRSNDLVGRMGGDEFAILMKNVSDTSSVLKKAMELSQTFRQTYAGEKEDYKISCSLGIIMIESNQDPFEVLYRKADAALYQAKQNGKDQFVLYHTKDAHTYPIGCTRTNDEELQNLKISHNLEAQIFELLYTSKDFNVSINMALATIGQHYHVSRVAIFENDDNHLTTSNIYEWCNDGIASVMEQLQKVMITSGTESILDSFDHNGLLYSNDVRELPTYLSRILESKGVLSTLKVTILNDEQTCGFIGFDECKEYRIWTAEEIEKLSYLSKVLSVFLFKKKAENSLWENLHTRLEILDVLPDYICVVNPETHMLEYTNLKMRELIPTAQPGTFCFCTLRGNQNGPCETCLVERIRRGDTDNLEIVSEDQRLHLNVKALAIKWAKSQNMVLLYGQEKMGEVL